MGHRLTRGVSQTARNAFHVSLPGRQGHDTQSIQAEQHWTLVQICRYELTHRDLTVAEADTLSESACAVSVLPSRNEITVSNNTEPERMLVR